MSFSSSSFFFASFSIIILNLPIKNNVGANLNNEGNIECIL